MVINGKAKQWYKGAGFNIEGFSIYAKPVLKGKLNNKAMKCIFLEECISFDTWEIRFRQ